MKDVVRKNFLNLNFRFKEQRKQTSCGVKDCVALKVKTK